jgi:hypothetical protein
MGVRPLLSYEWLRCANQLTAPQWRSSRGYAALAALHALPTSSDVGALYVTHLAGLRRAITVQRRLAAIS